MSVFRDVCTDGGMRSLGNISFETMLVMTKLLTPAQHQQLLEKLHSFSNKSGNNSA
jgi:hypothetical protein